ncbi:CHAP domain-containing protein [Oceanicaulis sp. MMSF_3324]|uniref:CHAP domain-containing protein n=1 Tax=Oceanicaulis sp. MMSF_3324 TaxID=3046702 RepID=UPI00273DA358|nr:CHAP domain-containing protein [Oceanicaulis sp. MMSF_3324]
MTGEDLVQHASRHVGEAYQLGAVADFDDPHYAGPWDCADFVSWCVYQTFGVRLGLTAAGHAYSGAWIGWAETPANALALEVAHDTPGAILVRRAHHYGAGHVAISDGRGGTIEARGVRYGVVRAKGRGRIWDLAGLVRPDQCVATI